MSTPKKGRRQGRRHTADPLAAHRLSVAVGRQLGARIEACADRFNVAVGIVLRYAIEAGLPAARKRLERLERDAGDEAGK